MSSDRAADDGVERPDDNQRQGGARASEQQTLDHRGSANEAERGSDQLHDVDFVPPRVQGQAHHRGHRKRRLPASGCRRRWPPAMRPPATSASKPLDPSAVVANIRHARPSRRSHWRSASACSAASDPVRSRTSSEPGNGLSASDVATSVSSGKSARKRVRARAVLGDELDRNHDRLRPEVLLERRAMLVRDFILQVHRQLGRLQPPIDGVAAR